MSKAPCIASHYADILGYWDIRINHFTQSEEDPHYVTFTIAKTRTVFSRTIKCIIGSDWESFCIDPDLTSLLSCLGYCNHEDLQVSLAEAHE